jgi:hypothetical protein
VGPYRPAVLITSLLVAAFMGACDGEGATGDGSPVDRGSALAGLPLRPDEAPEGLRLREDRSGPVDSLREVLPPREAVPNRRPVSGALAEAFRDGYQTVFAAPDAGGATPPEGLTSAASTAVRFADGSAAGRFLEYLREVQTGAGQTAGREEIPVQALGEGGFGWHHEVPFAESFGYVWRSGDLVLTVTVGGAIGATDASEVLDLAERVDGRAA